jgi:xeroderma pigmentosum group C-complementing protein
MSLTPLHLQASFGMIHKSRIPDQHKRGMLFESAIGHLTEWWSGTFFKVTPIGHIRNRTFDEVQGLINSGGDEDEEEEYEVIRSPRSLMKHALMGRGSRDVSSQLFTALCRALDIPARLVVSLQSLPWKASVCRPKVARPKGSEQESEGRSAQMTESESETTGTDAIDVKGKGEAKASADDEYRSDEGRAPGRAKGKAQRKLETKPAVRLRKGKDKSQKLGSSSSRRSGPLCTDHQPVICAGPISDVTATPPIFWTEVFSRPNARWIPVDPIRGIVNKRKTFDPSARLNSTSPASRTPTDNRMVYVLALEEDSYARDVTPRYAREYGAKVARMQLGAGRGRGSRAKDLWWQGVLGAVTRPYRLVI